MKFLLIFTLSLFLTSCDNESDESKMAKAEKECSEKTYIDDILVDFRGYFLEDADSVEICIKSINGQTDCYIDTIPKDVRDSIRHVRWFFIRKKVFLTDTVFVKIKNEPVKKVYDFKYKVFHRAYMLSSSQYECDFSSLVVDGKIEDHGASFDFWKKGFRMLERNEFKNYYYKTKKSADTDK